MAVVDADDHVVVLALDRIGASPTVITGTGLFIWNALDGRTTVDQIAREVEASYGVDGDLARAQISEFVSQLASMGIVQDLNAPAGSHDADTLPET